MSINHAQSDSDTLEAIETLRGIVILPDQMSLSQRVLHILDLRAALEDLTIYKWVLSEWIQLSGLDNQIKAIRAELEVWDTLQWESANDQKWRDTLSLAA